MYTYSIHIYIYFAPTHPHSHSTFPPTPNLPLLTASNPDPGHPGGYQRPGPAAEATTQLEIRRNTMCNTMHRTCEFVDHLQHADCMSFVDHLQLATLQTSSSVDTRRILSPSRATISQSRATIFSQGQQPLVAQSPSSPGGLVQGVMPPFKASRFSKQKLRACTTPTHQKNPKVNAHTFSS